MQRGFRCALALAAVSASISPAACYASAPAPPPHDGSAAVAAPAIPPGLQELEQKTLALQLTSVRLSVSETISGAGALPGLFGDLEGSAAHGKGKPHHTGPIPLFEGTGEESFAPLQGSFETSFLGLKSAERVIGTNVYVEEPLIAKLDGGRPWIEEPNQDLQQATGMGLATLGGKPGSRSEELFGSLLEAVNAAHRIKEVGPETVDGQPVTAFDASIAVNILYKDAPQHHAALKLVAPTAEVELLIAENGLPVRAQVRLRFRHHASGDLMVESDILAINLPVAEVQPPPPAETITEAQLKRLVASHSSIRKRHRRVVSK